MQVQFTHNHTSTQNVFLIFLLTYRTFPEEVNLPGTLLNLIKWLMQVFVSVIEVNFVSEKNSPQHQQILSILVKVLEKLISNQFLMANIHVAKQEDSELLKKIQKQHSEVKAALSSKSFASLTRTKTIEDQFELLISTKKAAVETAATSKLIGSEQVETITFCLQPFVAVNVLLNPNCSTQSYVSHLLMIQQLKYYSNARLYSELIRAALTSLCNVSRDSEINRESMWFAFTFIKVPYILKQLHAIHGKYNNENVQ